MRSDARFYELLDTGGFAGAGAWLVHRFADEVIGVSVAMVRDRTLAEDMAQDVFSRAFAALPEFRREASPRTWILRITKNRCIDHLRAERRDPWPDLDDGFDEETPPDHVPLPSDLIERRDEVKRALAELSEGDRALVVLRFRHGLDYSELALAFGIKEGTARMRLSRALARMRVRLGGAAKARALSATPGGGGRGRMRRAAAPKRQSIESAAAREHPLTAYFRDAWGPVSRSLRDRLLAADR